MTVIITEAAQADLLRTVRRYRAVAPPFEGRRLADLVLESYAGAAARIQEMLATRPEHPDIPGARTVPLGRFPYLVVYRVRGKSDAVIVAIRHAHSDYVAHVTRRRRR